MSFSVYQLKPGFQNLLRPLVRFLHKNHVTANQVTVLAMIISVLIGGGIAVSPKPVFFMVIPAWMFVRMAFNAIDGMLAREFGQKTPLGTYLNELADIVSDAALYLPFALLPEATPWVVVLFTCSAIVCEYSGVMAPMVGAKRRYDGPMGKSDRALLFGLLGFLVALNGISAIWLDVTLAIAFLLTVYTSVVRVYSGLANQGRLY